MNIGLMEERPPFIRFERRSIEDRNASISEGVARYRDVEFIILSQHGSTNTVEKEVESFFIDKQRDVRNGRIPQQWVDGWRRMHQEWKQGLEPVPDGTSVRLWPAISPAEADTLVAHRVLTVEDFAVLNDEGMRKLGMGWKRRQDQAKAFLASVDQNKAAEKLSAANARIGDLEAQVGELLDRVQMLADQKDSQKRPRREAAA